MERLPSGMVLPAGVRREEVMVVPRVPAGPAVSSRWRQLQAEVRAGGALLARYARAQKGLL